MECQFQSSWHSFIFGVRSLVAAAKYKSGGSNGAPANQTVLDRSRNIGRVPWLGLYLGGFVSYSSLRTLGRHVDWVSCNNERTRERWDWSTSTYSRRFGLFRRERDVPVLDNCLLCFNCACKIFHYSRPNMLNQCSRSDWEKFLIGCEGTAFSA